MWALELAAVCHMLHCCGRITNGKLIVFGIMGIKIRAGYARVSTEIQGSGVALQNHLQLLQENGCTRLYYDVASRSDNQRQSLSQLFADIRGDLIESVTIARIDRLTASAGLFEEFCEVLRNHGVTLICLDESVDLSNSDGVFRADMNVLLSKYELNKIRGRSARGHERRKANRRPNSIAPKGYIVAGVGADRHYQLDISPALCLLTDRPIDGQIAPGRTWAEVYRTAIDLFFRHRSATFALSAFNDYFGFCPLPQAVREQAETRSLVIDIDDLAELPAIDKRQRLDRPGFQAHSSLLVWLRNPVLRGHTPYATREMVGLDSAGRRVFGKRITNQQRVNIARDTHPDQAMMTDSDLQSIEAILKSNAKVGAWGAHQQRHPISGLIRCGVCGSRCKSKGTKLLGSDTVRKRYYACVNSVAGVCTNKQSIRSDRAEQQIIAALCDRAREIAASLAEPDDVAVEPMAIQQLREQIRQLNAIPNPHPAIATAINDLEQQLETALQQWRTGAAEVSGLQDILAEVGADPGYWEGLPKGAILLHFGVLVDRAILLDGSLAEVRLNC